MSFIILYSRCGCDVNQHIINFVYIQSKKAFMFSCYINLYLIWGIYTSYVSQRHFRLYDIHDGGRRDVTAVQFPQPPGPPGGTNCLHGALVVELVFPVDGQVDCICLLSILSTLQTLKQKHIL